MDSINLRYSLDLTGVDTDNLITREEVALLNYDGVPGRPFVLDFGFFYTDSLRLYDGDYRPLKANIDYVATYHTTQLSERSGLEVCGAVIITNQDISDTVYAEYQTVGGDYVFTGTILDEVLNHLQDHPGDVGIWAGIAGEPQELPPGGLREEVWKLDSFEGLNRRLEELTQALLAGDQTAMTAFREFIKNRFDQTIEGNDRFYSLLQAHMGDTDHPHRETKAQVGLGLIENYGVANRPEMEEGTRHDRYVTPRGAHEAVQFQAIDPLTEHINDTNNPHRVRPPQVGVYSKGEFNDLLDTKLDVDGKAVNSTRLNGYTYGQVRQNARSNIPAGNFTSGIFHPSRLGLNAASSANILRGDGRWMSIQQIFDQYEERDNGNVYFIGNRGNINIALNHIRVTYSDIRHYPVGTVVLFRVSLGRTVGADNGSRTVNFNLMRAAVRRSSGWTTL